MGGRGASSYSGSRSRLKYTEEELKQSVLDYAKEGFTKIRSDQLNGIYNREAEILEDYISKQSDERTLYRGIKMSYEDLIDIKIGDTIDQKGISSWTTSNFIADSFATSMARDGASVKFVLEGGTKKGADISAIKGTGRRRETETLISRKSKQVITGIEWENDVCYIKLKEK